MHVHGMPASSHRCLPEPALISVEWYLSSRRQSRCGPKAKNRLPNGISSGMQVRMNMAKGPEIPWALVRARLPSWQRGTSVGLVGARGNMKSERMAEVLVLGSGTAGNRGHDRLRNALWRYEGMDCLDSFGLCEGLERQGWQARMDHPGWDRTSGAIPRVDSRGPNLIAFHRCRPTLEGA